MPRYLNVVFQGGGVRGVAYAGALQTMPSECRVHTAAGASAGSIVASLLAIGKTPAEIKQILSDPEFFQLLEDADASRAQRIRAAAKALSPIWDSEKQKISWWAAIQFLRTHRDVLVDASEIWTQRGFHNTQRLRRWLDKITEGKSFAQATACEELRIVSADVERREYRIYTKGNDRQVLGNAAAFYKNASDRPIAEAIHASVSIPLFFNPFLDGSTTLVDGGLLSNFPSFLVGQGAFPTVAFRLDDFMPPKKITSTFDYLLGVLMTMAEAHDKLREIPPNFAAYPIYTHDISSTKFDLQPKDVELLYQLGSGVGNKVDWQTYSSETPEVSYFDPQPQRSLELSLKQAHALWRKTSSKELWLESLEHDAKFTVTIEKDWSTVYDRVGELRVKGSRPLFVTRFRITGVPTQLGGPMSLVDAYCLAEELLPEGKTEPLIRVPAFNGINDKGFLLFHTPPVTEGSPRRVHTRFWIQKEFARTLGRGITTNDDLVSYSAQQLATDHRLQLEFIILQDHDLPPIELIPEFGGAFVRDENLFANSSGRSYRRYVCKVPWSPVKGAVYFTVNLARKEEVRYGRPM